MKIPVLDSSTDRILFCTTAAEAAAMVRRGMAFDLPGFTFGAVRLTGLATGPRSRTRTGRPGSSVMGAIGRSQKYTYVARSEKTGTPIGHEFKFIDPVDRPVFYAAVFSALGRGEA